MTISPPAKINSTSSDEFRVLASGIDSLVLAIDILWHEENIFPYLAEMKSRAKSKNDDYAGKIKIKKYGEWPFNIKPHGTKGYEWLLIGNGFTLSIGDWLEPKSRPSVMAEIRSETLWSLTPYGAVSILKKLLDNCGAKQVLFKPSRVDLCVDLFLPKEIWNLELITFRVTRAKDAAVYWSGKELTGLSVGRGKISARLYDKPLEIRQKSKKFWMFDIWQLKKTPKDKKIIRVEFQFRREVLKELHIETVEELFKRQENIWAYCTQKWLKFRDRPGLQHNQRKSLPFWTAVQKGFSGEQKEEPLIRVKALATQKQQLADQAYGLLTSLLAVQHEELALNENSRAKLIDALDVMFLAKKGDKDIEAEFSEQVAEKRVKFHRTKNKAEEGYQKRREAGFPTGKDFSKQLNFTE